MPGPVEKGNVAEQKKIASMGNDDAPCSTCHNTLERTWWLNRRRVWIAMSLFCLFFWGAVIGLILWMS